MQIRQVKPDAPTPRRKHVAAYCRVSTDREDQANSFESQQRYFRDYICAQPGWTLYRNLCR